MQTMVEDFVLLKRIKAKLKTEEQWLVKTPLGDPAYKELGRWSRWRKNTDCWKGGFELLEADIDLLELASRVGVYDRSREKIRGKAVNQGNSVPYVGRDR